jgi:hypothetical protein
MAKKEDQNQPTETVTAPEQQPQTQLRIDDAQATTHYSSTSRIWGSAEEIIIDFSQGIRPAGPNAAVLKIDSRIILSPFAAKRLALALGQTVQRFEQTYGVIEIDPRKRAKGSTTQAS